HARAGLRRRGDGIRRRVGEGRLERARDEPLHHLLDDRVAEVFLASEVVVEVPLADAALPEHVVQGGAMVSLQVDEPGGGGEDLISRRRPLLTLDRRDRLGSGRRHHRLAPACTNWSVQTMTQGGKAVNWATIAQFLQD